MAEVVEEEIHIVPTQGQDPVARIGEGGDTQARDHDHLDVRGVDHCNVAREGAEVLLLIMKETNGEGLKHNYNDEGVSEIQLSSFLFVLCKHP